MVCAYPGRRGGDPHWATLHGEQDPGHQTEPLNAEAPEPGKKLPKEKNDQSRTASCWLLPFLRARSWAELHRPSQCSRTGRPGSPEHLMGGKSPLVLFFNQPSLKAISLFFLTLENTRRKASPRVVSGGGRVPSGLPTSRSTALAPVPAPLLTKGEPGSGSVQGDNPSPSRVKTGGRGGSGEGCVSRDRGGAPQGPTAGHGNANLTFSFSCHLVVSGTPGDCASFSFHQLVHPAQERRPQEKQQSCKHSHHEDEVFQAFPQLTHTELSPRESPSPRPSPGRWEFSAPASFLLHASGAGDSDFSVALIIRSAKDCMRC